LAAVADKQEEVREQVKEVQRITQTLNPSTGSSVERQKRFLEIQSELAGSVDPVRQSMAAVMLSFVVGLFVGGDAPGLPQDNLELERWFRLPKGHARRIHGRRHAGVRLVQEGATLLPALDAHRSHPLPFTGADLLPHRQARKPPCQVDALHRRKVMRKARSKKKRPVLLAQLERRYQAAR
jgi:hypothetical protein